MPNNPPSLQIMINFWSLWNQTNANKEEWSLEERMRAVQEAGFDAYSCPSETPNLKHVLNAHGLRFAGAFSADQFTQFEPFISDALSIDNGPMNCQLGDHDTPLQESIDLTVALMEVADKLGADVHLEMHRDTCTETPEKTYAIAEGFKKIKGYYPKINFDFSHPASLKHLHAQNYSERLFENIPLFQQSTLWHMRPFNGHHCQVPVTNGLGDFSLEYQEMRPFILQAFTHWLAGPRPQNQLWVVPELGPKFGYALSCFPNTWADTIVLGHDLRKIWDQALNTTSLIA